MVNLMMQNMFLLSVIRMLFIIVTKLIFLCEKVQAFGILSSEMENLMILSLNSYNLEYGLLKTKVLCKHEITLKKLVVCVDKNCECL